MEMSIVEIKRAIEDGCFNFYGYRLSLKNSPYGNEVLIKKYRGNFNTICRGFLEKDGENVILTEKQENIIRDWIIGLEKKYVVDL